MDIQSKITSFKADFYDGNEVEEEIEYVGDYFINEHITLKKLSFGDKEHWEESIIPEFYQDVYGLKVGYGATAGGLFESVPFKLFN